MPHCALVFLFAFFALYLSAPHTVSFAVFVSFLSSSLFFQLPFVDVVRFSPFFSSLFSVVVFLSVLLALC
jgi:hypothetical protein